MKVNCKPVALSHFVCYRWKSCLMSCSTSVGSYLPFCIHLSDVPLKNRRHLDIKETNMLPVKRLVIVGIAPGNNWWVHWQCAFQAGIVFGWWVLRASHTAAVIQPWAPDSRGMIYATLWRCNETFSCVYLFNIQGFLLRSNMSPKCCLSLTLCTNQ